MSKEQEQPGLVVIGIHINLKEGSIIFETEDEAGETQTLAAEGIIFRQPLPQLKLASQTTDSPPLVPEEFDESPAPLESSQPVEQAGPSAKEADPRSTLTGRLKNKPRPGRADRSGKPTAYARFSAHEEGEDKAHDYIATFHRHTTKIALNLAKNAQITVDGYPHKAGSEKRLDTFSVINIVNYPGKPQKK